MVLLRGKESYPFYFGASADLPENVTVSFRNKNEKSKTFGNCLPPPGGLAQLSDGGGARRADGATLTDHKLPHTTNNQSIDYYLTDITSAQDYYPGGMLMPGRSYSSDSYRFGFNGKEKDDEVTGNGNSIHFEFREYDPRTGRFKSIDPLGANYPWQSPYVFAANNPIVLVDIMGLGPGDPPTSTTGDANKKIKKLGANLQQSEHFKNVSPEEFINQLTERINNPSGISQGEGTNFCWIAACASYVYEKNPVGMVEAMFSLYTTGTFTYDNGGEGFSFSSADYINDGAGSGTFDDNTGLAGNKVDQMLFMTLGAKFKGYLNADDSYDPGDESTLWASGNLGKAKNLWNAFGYDVKVSGSDLGWGASNKGGTVMKTLKSHDVVLFVNSPLFLRDNWGANWWGTHYLRVDKMSSLGGNYTLDYWDYGSWKMGKDARRISHNQFWWSTYGMIAIPR